MKLFLQIAFCMAISIYTNNSFSQLAISAIPKSFGLNSFTNTDLKILDSINKDSLLAEDAITDKYKDIPWRFGKIVNVNYSLENCGFWNILPNGDKIWKLKIITPNAVSININYSLFHIPDGALFFLYTPDKKQVLGAFTSINHNPDGQFATSPLETNSVILEYYEPANATFNGSIEISEIVYGYRSLKDKAKGYLDSEPCNVNVVCDSILWKPEMRSVVMLLTSGNSRYCSGALVNNTKQDSKPYILTANHCGTSTNHIVMFGYWSQFCGSTQDGPTNKTLQGCYIRASDSPSDFRLLEMLNTPPTNYNVYYAGWNALNETPMQSTGIHHPSGDVMKISHDMDSAFQSGYYSAGNNHWMVADWDSGTTEGGSSGSPLFDQLHRIVGQLHGGNASCGNNEMDYYGKFSYSWNTDTDTLKQLKHWLDPDNLGVNSLDGYSPILSSYNLDAAALYIGNLNNKICGDSIKPIVYFRNNGNSTLTSIDLIYSYNGLPSSTITWTGSLLPYQTSKINLPSSAPSKGLHKLAITLKKPNNGIDQFFPNDTLQKIFFVNNDPHFLNIEINTDSYGSETSWEILDVQNNTISSGGPYNDVNGGETINHTVCLYDGCFKFVIKDSFGDGYCCAFGNGSFFLTDPNSNDTLASDNIFNASSDTFLFCLGDSCSLFLTAFVQFANPGFNDGLINLNVIGGSGNYNYAWSNSQTTQDISNLTTGTYKVIVTDLIYGCSDSLSVVIGSTNGIASMQNNQNWKIYPNPFTNTLNIEANNAKEISITDITGKIIFSENYNPYKKHIDLTQLGSGIYFLSISNKQQGLFSSFKIVKQ
jgi:hypothetical protein